MSAEAHPTPGPGQPQILKTSGGNNAYHNFHNDFLHVQDPNERRRLALAEIDKAPFGWYHVRYETHTSLKLVTNLHIGALN